MIIHEDLFLHEHKCHAPQCEISISKFKQGYYDNFVSWGFCVFFIYLASNVIMVLIPCLYHDFQLPLVNY